MCVTPSLQILKRMIDEDSHPTVCLLRPYPESFTASTEVKLCFTVEEVTTKAGGVPSALFRISPSNGTQPGQDTQVC